MPQLTNLQREVIVIFKKEHPTWGLSKCREVLPDFFGAISQNQYSGVANIFNKEGSPAAKLRRCGSGRKMQVDSITRQTVLDLAVTPPTSPKGGHFSQRDISAQLNLSKGTVFRILKNSKLKCFRRIKCNYLTDAHKQARLEKCMAMINRFKEQDKWKQVWFSDESVFSLYPPLNTQNERIYRAVEMKTDIPSDDLLVEIDKQQPSIMCYGAVSWYGKTELRFIEGYAADQEDLPQYKKKRKTVNQHVYKDEMCHQMFEDINKIMGGKEWTWQQDGAKAHTARDVILWLKDNTPDFIQPSEWPSKSPDLNVMDFAIWGMLLHKIQAQRREVTDIKSLKRLLSEVWDSISIEIIQKSTTTWLERLRSCSLAHGNHIEHNL